MGNKRIYEVAKDYGKPVNEVIDLLKKNNIEKTNFSAADDKAMSVIRKAYDKKPEPPKPAKTENVMSANRLLLRVRRIQLKETITI